MTSSPPITAHLHGQLHAAGEEVGEVLQAPGHHLQLLAAVVAECDGVGVARALPARGDWSGEVVFAKLPLELTQRTFGEVSSTVWLA